MRIVQTGKSPIFHQAIEVTIHRSDGTQAVIQQTTFPIPTSSGFRIGSLMRDITDRKQAELDLQRRMVELGALHAVAQAGTEANSTEDLMDRVAGIIREKLYVDHFGVAFLDEEAQRLVYHPSFTLDSCLAQGQISPNRGISGAVARTGLTRRTADVRLDADYVEGNPDTRSELCVPILIGSRVIGVFNLESAKIGSFTEADERLVTAIAGELGTALEKVRLLEAERSRRKELEALEQISSVLRTEENKDEILQAILERVTAVLNLKGAGFVFRDPTGGDLVSAVGLGEWPIPNGTHLPPGDGISHQVARTKHYYLSNDVPSDPRIQLPDPVLRLEMHALPGIDRRCPDRRAALPGTE